MKEKKISKCLKCDKKPICSDFCRPHFVEYFEKKVRRTIKQFGLLTHKDKVGVAVSGGKDSTAVLYVLHKLGYNPVAITVDAVIGNYTKENVKNLIRFCKKYSIPLKIISFREEFGKSLCYLRSVINSKGYNYSSCMICGVLRRFLLNKYAKEMKLDVLVTGHNLDDEAQAFLMNVFRNDTGRAIRQGPIAGKAKSKQFVKRVKPLYLISEKEVIAYSKLMKFPVKYGRCPCSVAAYRRNFGEMLDSFEKKFPDVKYKVIQFFLNTVHKMKAPQGNVGICSTCGEPASGDVCKACEILRVLRK
jgi:uncharacterized protein (TIGR00269 family)